VGREVGAGWRWWLEKEQTSSPLVDMTEGLDKEQGQVCSDTGQNRVEACESKDFTRTAIYLDEELLDLPIVDHRRVPPGALAEPTLRLPGAAHAHAASEEARAVRNQLHLLEISRVQRIAAVRVLLMKPLYE
jgi:hypothetical protein